MGNSLRGKTLWQIACITLIWMEWQERDNRIFEDKGRTEEMVWDLIQFYSSLWASCTEAFRGVPLNVLQLNWIGVCVSKVWRLMGFLFVFRVLLLGVFSFVQFCRKDLSSFPWFFALSRLFYLFCICSYINIIFFVSDQKKKKRMRCWVLSLIFYCNCNVFLSSCLFFVTSLCGSLMCFFYFPLFFVLF